MINYWLLYKGIQTFDSISWGGIQTFLTYEIVSKLVYLYTTFNWDFVKPLSYIYNESLLLEWKRSPQSVHDQGGEASQVHEYYEPLQ